MDEIRLPKGGTFYAQVDSSFTLQDYRPYFRCVRLIGVLDANFKQETFNSPSGCPTFVIDFAVDAFDSKFGLFRRDAREHFYPYFLDEEEHGNRWVELKYRLASRVTGAYAYEAFTGDTPQYLEVESVRLIHGPIVSPPEQAGQELDCLAEEADDVALTAFHVGQGMCSLLAGPNHSHGYLFDAGAGTPVLRESYRKGTHFGARFKSELLPALGHLKSLTVVLSHADCDHWRLLDWEPKLLTNVDQIFLPDRQPALVFQSSRVKHKTKGLGDAIYKLGSFTINVLRSCPKHRDKNGECLVVHIENEKQNALLPGDYVYSRMLTDNRTDGAIAALGAVEFDAVVVPHHGDGASANDVFASRIPGQSIAFFSAGDHSGYGHPTLPSIDAHSLRDFKLVEKLSPNIVACPLLP